MATTPSLDFRPLQEQLGDRLSTPASEDFDTARQAWNLVVDQQPAAVVHAESVDDVVAAVNFAREHGLRVAPQSTGHGANPIRGLNDALLVKTSRMRGVEIDAAANRARVQGGATWANVVMPAAEHGLAALAGSAPDVGVVGYLLGGGVSWLARHYGLGCNSMLAVELVNADGELVRADEEQNTDLLWALRGGGGSFGVVTAVEIELYPLQEVQAGWLAWPMERAGEVLNAWREWARETPDQLTSCGRLLRVPPFEEIPEMLRGRALVVIEAVIIGSEDDAQRLLEPLRALEPEIDTFATVPVAALLHLHMDPPEPVPGRGDGALLREFPRAAVDALVATAGGEQGAALLSLELRQLGGAIAREPETPCAKGSLEGEIAMFGVGMAPTPEAYEAVGATVERVLSATAPFHAEVGFMNFRDVSVPPEQLFDAESRQRLGAIRANVDPGGMFLANHPVG